ncbi:MAG: CHAT domain-containing protein [Flavobacteriales bacterium]|nr:CHAT domain-containing protein [Flavobacteriales bacterium]
MFRDTLMVTEVAVSPVALNQLGSKLREPDRSSAPGMNDQLHALFSSTMEPFLVARRVEAILVVPDGSFTTIPFEVLVASEAAGSPSATSFLGDQLVVRYGSSIHQFIADDQVAEANDLVYAGFAPLYPSSGPASPAPVRGSADVLRNLQPLNETDDEVEAAGSALSGRSFIGSEATEANFNSAAPEAGLIHLAMHSIVDAIVPMNSMLVFEKPALGDVASDTAAFDGLLHFHELIGLRLHADLAVLSACETGIGLYKTGEGVMSIARAFNYAGVPNVVSSLWKVDDLATKEIMVKFYEHLAEGMGKADALAEAKRWYRREHPDAPPSKWAAFILIGDNEPVRLKKRSPVSPWMWGGSVVVLVAMLAARSRRRSKLEA